MIGTFWFMKKLAQKLSLAFRTKNICIDLMYAKLSEKRASMFQPAWIQYCVSTANYFFNRI